MEAPATARAALCTVEASLPGHQGRVVGTPLEMAERGPGEVQGVAAQALRHGEGTGSQYHCNEVHRPP